MYYIQFKYQGQPLETIDSFTSIKDARRTLKDYQMGNIGGVYYISTRPCKSWNN